MYVEATLSHRHWRLRSQSSQSAASSHTMPPLIALSARPNNSPLTTSSRSHV